MAFDENSRGTGPRAGFWLRFGGWFIDGLLLGVVTGVLSLIFHHTAVVGDGLGTLISIAYFVSLEGGRTGATLGKRMVGIRVIDFQTGGPIGYGRALIRWIGKIIDTLCLLLGWLWMLWDSERQCWHDKLANDVVVPIAFYPVEPAAGVGASWR